MFCSFSIDIAAQLVHYKTNKELWTEVQELTGAATKAKILWYKGEFSRTRKGSTKMEEYLNKMKNIADNLQVAALVLSSTDLYTQILSGLDVEYTPIVVQLQEKENMSWIEFQTSLLTFEKKLEQLNSFQNMPINATTNLIHKTNNSSSDSSRNNLRGRASG